MTKVRGRACAYEGNRCSCHGDASHQQSGAEKREEIELIMSSGISDIFTDDEDDTGTRRQLAEGWSLAAS